MKFSKAIRISALALAFGMLSNLGVGAEQTLDDLGDAIKVELNTPLDGNTAKVGDLFEAKLKESVVFQSSHLPQDTTFQGHVSRMRESKRFGREGYLVLAVDKVIFPSGQTVEFTANEYEITKKLRDPKEERKHKLRYVRVPLSAASLVAPFPIGLAVKGGAGMIMGITDKTSDDNVGVRAVKGLYQGTPVATVVNAFKKPPAPVLAQGDTIRLYMPPEALSTLFELPENQGIPNASIPPAVDINPAIDAPNSEVIPAVFER